MAQLTVMCLARQLVLRLADNRYIAVRYPAGSYCYIAVRRCFGNRIAVYYLFGSYMLVRLHGSCIVDRHSFGSCNFRRLLLLPFGSYMAGRLHGSCTAHHRSFGNCNVRRRLGKYMAGRLLGSCNAYHRSFGSYIVARYRYRMFLCGSYMVDRLHGSYIVGHR